MKVYIPVIQDSDNTYPPEYSVEYINGYITLEFQNPYRKITIAGPDLIKTIIYLKDMREE